MAATGLDQLNTASREQAVQQLHACNAATRWVDEMLAGRPYANDEALLAAGDKAARDLSWSDVTEALQAHPRIGERATGDSVDAAWSRTEQAAVGDADADTQQALRDGNVAYEQRFGHVFLVRAADRDPQDMLAELRRRLGNDEISERAEVTEQLAQITRLRLERLLEG
jgi:2-oxo-4-hydroxy-4-carboxy-5-ureidoimidazoline decarboxylase